MWYKYLSNNVLRDFGLPLSALANGGREETYRQLLRKLIFPIGYFYITIADADIGSLKSLHTLFDKYLDHMLVQFEQNRMV